MAQIVRALDKAHDVKNFDCGSEALNVWLCETASQHIQKMLSRTYVLIDEDAPEIILGFYTVAIRAMTPVGDLPAAMQRRLPRDVPGFTLGRLAVSREAQGQGWGEYLLAHAMRRIREAAESVGGTFMFVDAKDAEAAAFYAKYDFSPMPSNPLRLLKPIAEIPA
ncbi:GNAT family N-acetyltransferase [Pseudoduganella violacea]|uniref:Ribosomal protein S18 acetylase RimI-like enzyme n=1 Tax=Pseudoduganella violacea TaxID=1715466 RepID=A0A7W5FWU4_9BURK|nr:GNAT family N-acetyltransferase [Pseudoduganella violacea]MBB3121628.1 ribosomal protein S18 acetylase RimI-like enzyme [Pseudoduganella violacea]